MGPRLEWQRLFTEGCSLEALPAAAFGFLWLSLGTRLVGAAGVWRSKAYKGWVKNEGSGICQPGVGTVIPCGRQWGRVGGLALSIAASALIATSVLLP